LSYVEWKPKQGSKELGVVVLVLQPVGAEEGLEEEEAAVAAVGSGGLAAEVSGMRRSKLFSRSSALSRR
jgi:hypothetical protein